MKWRGVFSARLRGVFDFTISTYDVARSLRCLEEFDKTNYGLETFVRVRVFLFLLIVVLTAVVLIVSFRDFSRMRSAGYPNCTGECFDSVCHDTDHFKL